MTLAFGQPDDALVQYAYVVEDIDRAMADFTAALGIGPVAPAQPLHPAGRALSGPSRRVPCSASRAPSRARR